jgi:hypothetical protein
MRIFPLSFFSFIFLPLFSPVCEQMLLLGWWGGCCQHHLHVRGVYEKQMEGAEHERMEREDAIGWDGNLGVGFGKNKKALSHCLHGLATTLRSASLLPGCLVLPLLALCLCLGQE